MSSCQLLTFDWAFQLYCTSRIMLTGWGDLSWFSLFYTFSAGGSYVLTNCTFHLFFEKSSQTYSYWSIYPYVCAMHTVYKNQLNSSFVRILFKCRAIHTTTWRWSVNCSSVLYIMPHIFNCHSLNFTSPYGVWFYLQTDVCISSKGEKKMSVCQQIKLLHCQRALFEFVVSHTAM